jgi:hypothetical protein
VSDLKENRKVVFMQAAAQLDGSVGHIPEEKVTIQEVQDLDLLPASAISAADRIRLLKEMIGNPSPEAGFFPSALQEHTRELWARHVEPIFEAHWPEGFAGQDFKKLRFLTCNLYASAPYTVLFCSDRAPRMIRWATSMATSFKMSPETLHRGASVILKLFSNFSSGVDHRRIVMISAFISTIDHAFDHYMGDLSPKEREARIKGLLGGTWEADHGSLKLTRALQVAMSEDIPDDDRPAFDAAIERVVEWCESEVAGLMGMPDPQDLGHRLAGVEGTIDGLIFPVYKYAGATARKWMYDVSMFTQMMDDWIDFEADSQDVRETPVISGKWNLRMIREKWVETETGIIELAKEAGLTEPTYLNFVRDSYSYMMCQVMDAMADGVAA